MEALKNNDICLLGLVPKKQGSHINETPNWFINFSNSLDKVLNKIWQKLESIEQRLDKVEQRLDKVEQRLDKVEQRLDKLDSRIDNLVKKNNLKE